MSTGKNQGGKRRGLTSAFTYATLTGANASQIEILHKKGMFVNCYGNTVPVFPLPLF